MRSKRITPERKQTIQLWLGFILAIAGLVLIGAGFLVPPMGVIDPTVLAAIGEVFTFSGALIGVDYHYQTKRFEFLRTHGGAETEETDEGN